MSCLLKNDSCISPDSRGLGSIVRQAHVPRLADGLSLDLEIIFAKPRTTIILHG